MFNQLCRRSASLSASIGSTLSITSLFEITALGTLLSADTWWLLTIKTWRVYWLPVYEHRCDSRRLFDSLQRHPYRVPPNGVSAQRSWAPAPFHLPILLKGPGVRSGQSGSLAILPAAQYSPSSFNSCHTTTARHLHKRWPPSWLSPSWVMRSTTRCATRLHSPLASAERRT